MLRLHTSDPSPGLEAAFQRIEHERMAGLPLLHEALRVQALDFQRWQGQWLGALVTPWFINLVLVPGDTAGWRSAAVGARAFHRFGAGDFAFIDNEEPEIGEFQTCSLVSPVNHFPDHETACMTARMALRMLHVEQPAASLMTEGATCDRAAALTAPDPTPARPSRRVILFGSCGTAG